MIKRKSIIYTLCVCFTTLMLTGCGNEIPELTEEQNALVTEYAAGLLLEYHADYQSKLVDTAVPMEEETSAPAIREQVPVSQNSASGTENSDAEANVTTEEETPATQPVATPQISVSQVLGMTDFAISYAGYEVCESYPNEQTAEDDLFFAMQAGAGNKLVVLKLQIANTKDQTLTFNTLALSDIKSRIVVNGKKHNVLVTMLDNDFMALEQEIEPGASMEAVVVAEISAEEAEQIQTIQFYVENGKNSTTIEYVK